LPTQLLTSFLFCVVTIPLLVVDVVLHEQINEFVQLLSYVLPAATHEPVPPQQFSAAFDGPTTKIAVHKPTIGIGKKS